MSRIRPFQDRDYEAFAAIRNTISSEPVTAAELRDRDTLKQSVPGFIDITRVAETDNGAVVGIATLRHGPEEQGGRWNVTVQILPEARHKGIGSALFAEALSQARAHGATVLRSFMQGGDEASLAWAKRRGFYVERERTESVLDLAGWDPTPFGPDLEKVKASGISLNSTRKVESERLLHGWYEVVNATIRDIPGWDSHVSSFDVWRRNAEDQNTPKEIVFALDGDRVVGVSVLGLPHGESKGAVTFFTGVLREYRGRGIALAVKLLTVEAALRAGASYMRTHNDPDNPAMLAVNEKMGYRRVPGPLRLERKLV